MPLRRQLALQTLCLLFATTLTTAEPIQRVTPSIAIPAITKPPEMAALLSLDGIDAATAGMLRVEEFTARYPQDGVPSSERTWAFIGRDEKRLYAVFICHDSRPDLIRARLASRDAVGGDEDVVSITLDTFHDRKTAYSFYTNALGVQVDTIWNESSTWDPSWDTIWHSEGRLTSYGYAVIISVPFESLRYSPSAAQTWGVVLFRGIPRKNEVTYWPPFSRKIAGRLNQTADASLDHPGPVRNMQFVPYVSGRAFRSREFATGNSQSARAELRAGLDAKFVIRDSFVLDITLNPEFSQVESDQPQITTNQRFELYYPEKRPFFLENSAYFASPINLLFTRRIADPSFGARLTGKQGPWAIGVLAVDDRAPGRRYRIGEPLYGERALFTAVRVNRDLGKYSGVGAIYTGRNFGPSHNHVAGLDARWKLNSNWIASGQAVASNTRTLVGSASHGTAAHATLSHAGRSLNATAHYLDRSPGFISESGFVNRVDMRAANATASYRWFPENKVVAFWGPVLITENLWDHSGTRLDRHNRAVMHVEMFNQSRVVFTWGARQEALRPKDFPVLNVLRDYNLQSWSLGGETGLLRQVSFGGDFVQGTAINFRPAAGPPVRATLSTAKFFVTARPSRSLGIDNLYLASRLRDEQTGAGVLTDQSLRSNWTYYVSRSVYLRGIVQYSRVTTNPRFTQIAARQGLNFDVLAAYVPHPGTSVFVGYNSNLEADFGDPASAPQKRFVNDGRQFFIKLSYSIRR